MRKQVLRRFRRVGTMIALVLVRAPLVFLLLMTQSDQSLLLIARDTDDFLGPVKEMTSVLSGSSSYVNNFEPSLNKYLACWGSLKAS